MSVKIVFLLFCVAVITQCEPQFNPLLPQQNNYPLYFPDHYSYSSLNNGNYRGPPSYAQNTGPKLNKVVENQSVKKETINPETQSLETLNKKFDLTKPTDSQFIRNKPGQDPFRQQSSPTYLDQVESNIYKSPSELPNNNQAQYPTSNHQDGFTSRVQLNKTPFESKISNIQLPQKYSTSFVQRPKEEKFEDYKPITEFSWNLFKHVNTPQNPNLVISPLSPQHILSYLASGAKGNTKEEIVRAISYTSPNQLNSLISTMLKEPGKKELQLASAFFVSERSSLNLNFQRNLAENTEIIPTDFSNNEKFNRDYSKWVAEKTKGALTNVRVKTEPSTRMLMSSAVYFKGEWVYKLNPGGIDDFYVTENNPIKVPMMKLLKKLPHGQLKNGNGEWISLPYNSDDSMVIILPRKGVQLDDFIQNLNIQDVFDAMNNENYGNVTLTLPKFKVESRFSLINPLQQMGIRELFSSNAQLPNVFSSNEPLLISNVLQQSSLEINEEGSIATSLTAFGVVALSFSPPTPDVVVKVDRPFIAMITNRKKNFPYFVAKITNPAV